MTGTGSIGGFTAAFRRIEYPNLEVVHANIITNKVIIRFVVFFDSRERWINIIIFQHNQNKQFVGWMVDVECMFVCLFVSSFEGSHCLFQVGR